LIPNSKGTDRHNQKHKFKKAKRAKLEFDVKFEKGWKWGSKRKGGKLMGLGGGTATTGCRPISKKGWTVRIMWRDEGKAVLYVYHQNRKERCGDNWRSSYTFSIGKWQRMGLEVKLNSSPSKKDGEVWLYANGRMVEHVKGLRLTGDKNVEIDTLMWEVFFGGNSREWAPPNTVYVSFDNFKVTTKN